MSEPERLSYRAVAAALGSLLGPVPDERAPSEVAVRYRPHPPRGIPPLMDIYAPARPRGDGASVMIVHGGGFFIGSRRMKPARLLASRLSDAGLAVATLDYRMILRGGRLDESLDDVGAALRAWREGCDARSLSPERVSMLGLSAGATLTLLAAAAPDARLHRVVSCFGLYELDHLHGPLASVLPRLLFRTRDRARWAARSPRGAAQTDSPTLLLHGTADGLVPVAQARRLDAHRRELGLDTRLVEFEGAPHGFFNDDNPHAARALDEILRHLDVG